MKFRNSEVPLTYRKDATRAAELEDRPRLLWFESDSFNRFLARREKLLARKAALRAANRRIRRQRGLSLKYA